MVYHSSAGSKEIKVKQQKMFFMDLLYYISLSLSLSTAWILIKGKRILWRKIQGKKKEDTEGLCNNKHNYKSQFIITVMANYKKHKCNS